MVKKRPKLKESDKVILFEEEGILKIISKKKFDLNQFFDSLEFEEGLFDKLDKWTDYEKNLQK
ncbi:MAG: hypothetical protein ACOC44_20205 [Promethearchaeia archaeon]